MTKIEMKARGEEKARRKTKAIKKSEYNTQPNEDSKTRLP
jgi:hypothetical protein